MLKDEILALLRDTGDYVSGQEMSSRLGVTRAAVWKAVETLRQEGYEIDSVTRRGYRLAAVPDRLTQGEVLACLGDSPWRDRVRVLDTVESTNNLCKTLAAQGAPDGTVILADHQTGGRGRMGRSFFSPPGMGVYLSVILRPDTAPQNLLHLTCAFAAAMCDAVERACGLRPEIKWTNDLIHGGRKLSGILTELSIEAESGRVQYAVLGIGVNCGQKPGDFPPEVADKAGSLSMAVGGPVDRNRLAAEMIRSSEELSRTLLTEKACWMEKYRRDCMTIGKDVEVLRFDAMEKGRALDVDENGGLVVRYPDGREETVSSGEVSVRGLYGYV